MPASGQKSSAITLLFNFLLPPNLKNVLAEITDVDFGKTTLIQNYWLDVRGKDIKKG